MSASKPQEWWYLASGNVQKGPVLAQALCELKNKGEITESTYVWKQGMKTWTAYRSVAASLVAEDDPEAQKKRTRVKVLRELVETEQSYINQLSCLKDSYLGFVKALARSPETILLTIEEADTLFGNVEQLYEVNKHFLSDLIELPSLFEPLTCVGDVICGFVPYFKVYAHYANNYEKGQQLLRELYERSDAPAKRFIEYANRTDAAKGVQLSSLLITPIQRVPRYELLIGELLKQTWDDHPDLSKLKNALEEVKKVAGYINESVRRMKEIEQVRSLEAQFTEPPSFLIEGRFVHRGPLTKVCRKKDVLYEFFLFENSLCYAKESLSILRSTGSVGGGTPVGPSSQVGRLRGSFDAGVSYTLHRKIPVNSAFKFEDAGPEFKQPHAFSIQSSEKSFFLYAQSEEEKKGWMEALGYAVDKFNQTWKGREYAMEVAFKKPLWVPDNCATTCTLCNQKFSLFVRKHHCRACGALVCGSCSEGTIHTTTSQDKVRACDDCYAIYVQRGMDGLREGEAARAARAVASPERSANTAPSHTHSALASSSSSTDLTGSASPAGVLPRSALSHMGRSISSPSPSPPASSSSPYGSPPPKLAHLISQLQASSSSSSSPLQGNRPYPLNIAPALQAIAQATAGSARGSRASSVSSPAGLNPLASSPVISEPARPSPNPNPIPNPNPNPNPNSNPHPNSSLPSSSNPPLNHSQSQFNVLPDSSTNNNNNHNNNNNNTNNTNNTGYKSSPPHHYHHHHNRHGPHSRSMILSKPLALLNNVSPPRSADWESRLANAGLVSNSTNNASSRGGTPIRSPQDGSRSIGSSPQQQLQLQLQLQLQPHTQPQSQSQSQSQPSRPADTQQSIIQPTQSPSQPQPPPPQTPPRGNPPGPRGYSLFSSASALGGRKAPPPPPPPPPPPTQDPPSAPPLGRQSTSTSTPSLKNPGPPPPPFVKQQSVGDPKTTTAQVCGSAPVNASGTGHLGEHDDDEIIAEEVDNAAVAGMGGEGLPPSFPKKLSSRGSGSGGTDPKLSGPRVKINLKGYQPVLLASPR